MVVDVDLEKFFDRVNHDILMDRLAKRIADKRVLRLIRRYLQAGIMVHGVSIERHEGTPQGGPLVAAAGQRAAGRGGSGAGAARPPLRALRRRLQRLRPEPQGGRAGAAALRGCYAKLALEGQRDQERGGLRSGDASSWATASGQRRKARSGGRWPVEALARLRERIRQLTRRTRGRSLEQIAADLRSYVPGWKAYFRLAQTPRGLARTGRMAASPAARRCSSSSGAGGRRSSGNCGGWAPTRELAARIAGNARRWWRNSALGLNRVLPIAYFDRLGCPAILLTSTSRTARCGPACRVVWEGPDQR